MSVTTALRDHCFHVTLDRPEKRNAFDGAIVQALREALEAAGKEDRARVIVLDAVGRHFSAGADLEWMRRMADMDHEENRQDALALAGLMRTLDRAPKPVICRVQGAAFGGALGLIAAADIAIASDDARFRLSEVRLGILPAVISPYVVRALGPRQARRYFMSGEEIDAPRARELDLVHEILPETELDARVEAIAGELAMGAPAAQLRVRELIDGVAWKQADPELLEWTAGQIADLRAADEGREGLDAFLQKRPPVWQSGEKGS